jgi:hypothetical protein
VVSTVESAVTVAASTLDAVASIGIVEKVQVVFTGLCAVNGKSSCSFGCIFHFVCLVYLITNKYANRWMHAMDLEDD